jgi:hypothetical protein
MRPVALELAGGPAHPAPGTATPSKYTRRWHGALLILDGVGHDAIESSAYTEQVTAQYLLTRPSGRQDRLPRGPRPFDHPPA